MKKQLQNKVAKILFQPIHFFLLFFYYLICNRQFFRNPSPFRYLLLGSFIKANTTLLKISMLF